MHNGNSSITEKTEPKQQKYFVDSRLSDPVFKDWLSKDRKNTREKCTVCHKVIELSSGGHSTWTIHGNGNKHKESVEKKMDFFKPKNKVFQK